MEQVILRHGITILPTICALKIQLIPSKPTTVHDIAGSRCACHITTAVPNATAADSTGVRLQAASGDDLCRRGGREGCMQGNTLFLQNILRPVPKIVKSDSQHSQSISPHGRTRLPVDRISWNLILQFFF